MCKLPLRSAIMPVLATTAFLCLPVHSAKAQGARVFLDSFENICRPRHEHDQVTDQFASNGWSPVDESIDYLYQQDLSDPDEKAYFVYELPEGGHVLAAALNERRGLFFNRNKTVCFVRILLEDPARLRDDFRRLFDEEPDETVTNEDVMADVWFSLIKGQIFVFRAVRASEEGWMVTAYRVFSDG